MGADCVGTIILVTRLIVECLQSFFYAITQIIYARAMLTLIHRDLLIFDIVMLRIGDTKRSQGIAHTRLTTFATQFNKVASTESILRTEFAITGHHSDCADWSCLGQR